MTSPWLIAGDARLGHLVQRLMPVSSTPSLGLPLLVSVLWKCVSLAVFWKEDLSLLSVCLFNHLFMCAGTRVCILGCNLVPCCVLSLDCCGAGQWELSRLAPGSL